jgi:ribosomal protein L32E
MPDIGYGSDKKTRRCLPNGFKKFFVHNVSFVELLMMHDRYCFCTLCCLLLVNTSIMIFLVG